MKRLTKNLICLSTFGLMIISLVLAACSAEPVAPVSPPPSSTPNTQTPLSAPAAPIQEKPQQETAAPVLEKPKYGGMFNRALTGDVTSFDFFTRSFSPGVTFAMTNDGLVDGDWTKGPAGGYGTNETDWTMGYDVIGHKTGMMAESWKWTVDFGKNTAALVYQIRPGVHYGLNQKSEASRLVNGREMTADDVVYTLRTVTQDSRMYVYSAAPELRQAEITKTGAWEVTVTTTVDALLTAFQRLNYWGRVVPKEVISKYGSMSDWRHSVGTGPYILTDNIPGSLVLLEKNPDYWMLNPVGTGKGDKLPYVDGIRYIVVPDASTRYAALRTGKIDQLYNVSIEDIGQLKSTTPELIVKEQAVFGGAPISLRVDVSPTSDVKVRRAMMMATDFEAINNGLYDGEGIIHTWPWPATKGYEAAFLALDDPKMPESVREQFVYNPQKAKQLLAEAGYPNGFKVEALMVSTEVDYYSILKDMWSKVGIELEFMIRETGVKTSLLNTGTHPPVTSNGVPQARMYYFFPHLIATSGVSNPSMVNDKFVNEAITRIKKVMVTDEQASMRIWKDELMAYVLDQAYSIPRVIAPSYNFWWPWVKNYSGEIQLGESLRHQDNWTKFIWIDQELKKSMGYR